MQFGLVISVMLHAAMLGWAFITIQSQRELRMPEPDPIITGLVTESELTKLKQGARTAKQLEAMAKEVPKAGRGQEGGGQAQAGGRALLRRRRPIRPRRKADPIAEKLASAEPPPPPPAAADEQKQLEEAAAEAASAEAEEQRARRGAEAAPKDCGSARKRSAARSEAESKKADEDRSG